MKTLIVLTVASILCSALVNESALAITNYNDRDQFVAAAGSGLKFEGFDDIPTDSVGQAAFSDGAVFGGGAFSVDALSLDTDVTLSGMGLIGTFLVRTSPDPEINLWPGPGGIAGTSNPRDDDDFSITFTQPLRAFGILIVENHIEAGENISLYDVDGQLITAVGLPGNRSGIGGNGFRGFVASSPLEYIKTVIIEEGQTLNDDIGFDWVYFDPVPEPSAQILFAGLTMGLVSCRRPSQSAF